MKILAVDDDVRVREMLHEILSRLGYGCRTASNGREALNILHEDYYPIVVCDVVMPEMDGIELIREIRKYFPDIDVLSMTGYCKDYTFTDVVHAGASDFILKPFSNDELEAKLDRIIRERKLKEKEHLMALFAELDPAPVLRCDTDGNILMANSAAANLLHQETQSLVGMPLLSLIPGIKKLGLTDCIHNGTVLSHSTFIGNRFFHFKIKGVPNLGIGQIYGRDITERKQAEQELTRYRYHLEELVERRTAELMKANQKLKQEIIERKQAEDALRKSEERFRELVENSLTGISIVQNDKIIYQNPEQERLLGPLSSSFKFSDYKNIHPEDVEKVKGFYQSILSGTAKTVDVDFRFYLDGNNNDSGTDMRWVNCHASVIEYQGGNALLVNMMDITRAKELEHLLRIKDKMASLGRVAAGIAHELRNPLSGINIYLTTLDRLYDHLKNIESEDHEKGKRIIEQLRSASDKIESVVKKVMDFARPSVPKLSPVDINHSIEEAINLSSITLRKKGITIKASLSQDLPKCYADSNLIEQVLLNLITNAAHAMNDMDSNKKIRISSSRGDNHVLISVADTGPGVPLKLRDKIFDPFYTTRSNGFGIGLSLSHRIITDHGGSLDIFTSNWGGAEFRIEIPIEKRAKRR